MSNINALYTELTTLPDEGSVLMPEADKPKEQDAGRQQLIYNWKQSTVTKEFMDRIDENIIELFEESIKMAVNNAQQPNANKIIANLVRIDTLRKMKQYV